MKISIYVFTLIALFNFSYSAVDYTTKAVMPKPKPTNFTGSLEQYYPLEIELKDDATVKVTITSEYPNGEKEIKNFTLGQAKVARLDYKEVDINGPITIELDIKSNKGKGIGSNYQRRYIIDPNVKNTPRTVYLKIENDKLLPRVGSTFGSKTPSGLSVKNNITAKQINLIK